MIARDAYRYTPEHTWSDSDTRVHVIKYRSCDCAYDFVCVSEILPTTYWLKHFKAYAETYSTYARCMRPSDVGHFMRTKIKKFEITLLHLERRLRD